MIDKRSMVAQALGCMLLCSPLAAAVARPSQIDGTSAMHSRALAAADRSSEQYFDIPAQPLTGALTEFSRHTGLRVSIEAAVADGVPSPGVTGSFTVVEALRRLLIGTGFTWRFTDGRTVAVSRADGEGREAQGLRPILITESAARPQRYTATRTTTAMKTDTPLRDTPQSVTVISRELIADQAMQGMADVVRYIPGISMGQGEGHRDAPTIRGNSSTADFFVDGVRDDAQYFRDLYNVERVEALKGANAMIFGRGGGGGVLNRVSKEAQWLPTRNLTLEGGSFGHKRGMADVGQGFGRALSARLTGVYENSNTFRSSTRLERIGLNPTAALVLGARTTARLGYEFFDDDRTVDRGIPSYQGRPSHADISTFFGDPNASTSRLRAHATGALLEHYTPFGLTIRNRTRFAHFDKFYQNVYPGAVNALGTSVNLSAYNSGTVRGNLFNQTDLTYALSTGAVRHTLLVGAELGRQATDNVRRTGYFNNTLTSLSVPFDQPTVVAPVTFRQSATDADNRTVAHVAALYAQNQIELGAHWQAIAGVRYDHFAVRFHNNRNGDELRRDDHLVSPRAGLVFKPVEPVSFYGTYSVSYLPSSGDQFSSLTATSRTLEPEQFTNREVGAKWDIHPDLALTTAVYRLDRTNTAAPDPNDPARTIQTGSQRTTGYEVGVAGRLTSAWQVAGGYALQRATITSTTTSAKSGATVPLVPHHTLSLWNRYQVVSRVGVGLGVIHQADMYAAIDNSVTLPSFTRVDGAVYVGLNQYLRAQLNLENLLDRRYYGTSHGNNNIMPGAPRTVRLSLVTGL